jgi:hypothetical protein
MAGVWITDMTHFLDGDGRVPVEARPLVRFLGAIVKATVSRSTRAPSATLVRCRRRPGRQPCTGSILAAIEPGGEIRWRCPVCDDQGQISNWQKTPWAQTPGVSPRPSDALALEFPALTPLARRAWRKVSPSMRVRLLNNVWCASCRSNTSIAVDSGVVTGGDLVLHGRCTRCGGDVARVIEGTAGS